MIDSLAPLAVGQWAIVMALCYVHTQLFLFIFNGFPLWLFLELDSLLWNIVLEVSGPFYNLITRNYATDFNMNFFGSFSAIIKGKALYISVFTS